MPKAIRMQPLSNRDLGQVDILHDRPDDGQTTGFRRKGVYLIRSLPNIAKETLDSIGTSDVAVHDRWKSIKRQEMFFIDASAVDGFGRALLIFGECSRPN